MLPDYLAPDLDAVFVGTAAGERSALRGHYYSGRGNKFWELLWEAGLTGDRILIPDQDEGVLSYGVELTDVAKAVAASTDSKLRAGDYEVPAFLARIEGCQPGCVAFNGKTAAGVVAVPPTGQAGSRTHGLRHRRFSWLGPSLKLRIQQRSRPVSIEGLEGCMVARVRVMVA